MMNELAPTITLDDQGQLTLHYSRDYGVNEKALGNLEPFCELEHQEAAAVVTIDDIAKLVSTMINGEDIDYPQADNILWSLNALTSSHYAETEDRVFDVVAFPAYVSAEVFPQAQGYMNQAQFTEDLAASVLRAMALPFPKKFGLAADRTTKISDDGRFVDAADGIFTFGVSEKDFSFVKLTDEGGSRRIEVDWCSLGMSTLGNCACFGLEYDQRREKLLLDEVTSIYTLSSHNIDGSHQSLSLTLGMARLAHEAMKSTITDGLFQEGDWQVLDSSTS